MKTLLIFRHAQAGHSENTVDHERPLTEKGVRDAQRMGRCLRGIPPDQVFCSTALRARHTAEEALAVARSKVNLQTLGELYDSDLPQHIDVVQRGGMAVERLLVVGHNPTLETLAARLVRRPVTMKTGALAIIAAPIPTWGRLSEHVECELVGLFYPELLKKSLGSDAP